MSEGAESAVQQAIEGCDGFVKASMCAAAVCVIDYPKSSGFPAGRSTTVAYHRPGLFESPVGWNLQILMLGLHPSLRGRAGA